MHARVYSPVSTVHLLFLMRFLNHSGRLLMKLIGCLGFSNLLLLFSGCPHPFSHYFLLTFSVKLHATKMYRDLEESQKKRYSSGNKRNYAGVRNRKGHV